MPKEARFFGKSGNMLDLSVNRVMALSKAQGKLLSRKGGWVIVLHTDSTSEFVPNVLQIFVSRIT